MFAGEWVDGRAIRGARKHRRRSRSGVRRVQFWTWRAGVLLEEPQDTWSSGKPEGGRLGAPEGRWGPGVGLERFPGRTHSEESLRTGVWIQS